MSALITAIAQWAWTPDSGGPALTLNDRAAWPRYIITWPIKGLRATADSDDNREANTEHIGETAFDSYAHGKTITIAGRTFGRTFLERVAADDDLVAAFGADLSTGQIGSGRMVITPNAGLGAFTPQTFTAVCRDCEPLEGRASSPGMQPSPYFSDFTIDLRLADPRFYDWDGAAATNPKW